MTEDEIQRHLTTGASRSVAVDVRIVPGLSGWVRTVFICSPNRVRIEFDQWGVDEGGVYFEGKYPSLPEIVQALEAFLGQRVAEWHNFTQSGRYPVEPGNENSEGSDLSIRDALRSRSIALPGGSDFQIQSTYWSQYWGA